MIDLNLEVGKKYLFDHTRKGRFEGKVISQDEEWVTVVVTAGKANFLSPENNLAGAGEIGEDVTMKKSMITVATQV